jgi:succinate dehydrogenase/fumarate reductase-like Fe-S protein
MAFVCGTKSTRLDGRTAFACSTQVNGFDAPSIVCSIKLFRWTPSLIMPHEALEAVGLV